MSVEIIRSWLLLHLSARVNISLVSNFLIKLMKLPISFFDAKKLGDMMQRVDDHHRIETLLTNQTLSVLFSFFNFVVFSIVLVLYSFPVFLIFLAGSIIYFSWVQIFLKRRKDLDCKRWFRISCRKKSATLGFWNVILTNQFSVLNDLCTYSKE